jgi:acetyl esterase/lipase
VPERYAQASPRSLLPLGVPQVLILGQYEEFVPLALAEEYVAAARRAGDSVRLEVIPGVGHFEIASPRARTWPSVSLSIRTLLESTAAAGQAGTPRSQEAERAAAKQDCAATRPNGPARQSSARTIGEDLRKSLNKKSIRAVPASARRNQSLL